MFTPVSMRLVNSYKNVGVETSVSQASPHQLIGMLFDGLLQSLAAARGGILNKDIGAKSRAISRAVRILEEGLKAGLDIERGGELALNLRDLYDFCIFRLTEANLRNDAKMVDEVVAVIQPVADGWGEIRDEVAQRRAA